MSDVAEGLYSYLLASTDVVNQLAGTVAGSTFKMFPSVLPQNVTMPAITYQVISGEGQHHLGASSGLVRYLIQVDSYGDTQLQANTTAEILRLHLDGYRGAMGSESCHRCELSQRRYLEDQPRDASDSYRYRVSQDYTLWVSESLPHKGST